MYSLEYKSLKDRLYEKMIVKGTKDTFKEAMIWKNQNPEQPDYKNPKLNSIFIKHKYSPNFIIKFPGRKTEMVLNKLDYQVSVNNIAISHVNIIVDFYNKVKKNPELYPIIEEFILDIALVGHKIDKIKYKKIDEIKVTPPPFYLTKMITDIHKKLSENRLKEDRKKISYQYQGNSKINYSLDELIFAISLILLQEDINYPKKEGRRMPLKRYLEGIYLALYGENLFNWEQLIDRTQFDGHGAPIDFNTKNIKYEKVNVIDVDWT